MHAWLYVLLCMHRSMDAWIMIAHMHTCMYPVMSAFIRVHTTIHTCTLAARHIYTRINTRPRMSVQTGKHSACIRAHNVPCTKSNNQSRAIHIQGCIHTHTPIIHWGCRAHSVNHQRTRISTLHTQGIARIHVGQWYQLHDHHTHTWLH